jgi:drug/metabolite transporter (DMT)-like permease
MAWWAGGSVTPVSRRDWITIVWLGFIGYYLGSYLDFAGLQYISAGLGRLILYLYPTLVLLLSAAFLKQPIRARHLVSLALSYAGIALAFQHEIDIGEDLPRMALGAVLVFGGAVTYAIYLIIGSGLVQRLGSMRFTAYASISASLFVIAHFMITHGPARLVVAHQVYALTLLMAVVSTVLPLWLLAEGLKRIGANQSSLVACIGPLATILFAHMFLGEPVTAVQLAGAALVLAGIMIISVKPRAAPPDTTLK